MRKNKECVKLEIPYFDTCSICEFCPYSDNESNSNNENDRAHIPDQGWGQRGREAIIHTSIIRRNILCMGVGELYRVIDQDIPFDIGKICDNCLENYKYEPLETVNCHNCSKKYKTLWSIDSDSGDTCEANVYDNYIMGGYYSCCDNIQLWYVDHKPDYLQLGSIICDECINHLIDEKIVSQDMPSFIKE